MMNSAGWMNTRTDKTDLQADSWKMFTVLPNKYTYSC
jgi:hypothetical protein